MKNIIYSLGATIALAALTIGTGNARETTAKSRPNFLIIVADDLGYSDLGAFGGEIRTPNLDALAKKGVRFTDFHSAPACSPTRAMLLTGTDPHRVGLGAMELQTPNQIGTRGNEGYLRADNVTLPEILSAAGYRTLLSGKWHLGTEPGQDPHARGFQRSFALLPAAHNHFGLGLSTERAKGMVYTEDGRVVERLPENFYSSTYFAERLADFLKEGDQGPNKDKPFFAYLAFSAPHQPLQALPEDIARYKGAYDAGFNALEAKRLKKQAALGLYDPSKPIHVRAKPPGGWAALTPADKVRSAREMEIYAAMVDRLDHGVGLVLAELRRSGKLDNTVVIFLSDNGAEGMSQRDTQIESLRQRYAQADNRLENLGSATSLTMYGPGWASAAVAPSWLYKTYATEGGTRVPSFFSGPEALVGKRRIGRAFANAADVLPTILEMANVPAHGGAFQGRKVEPIQGTSMLGYLLGRAERIHDQTEAFGTELFGSRSIRKGEWKIIDTGDGSWRLFNLANDPGETTDLSTRNPAKFSELLAEWDRYAREVGVVLPTRRLVSP
ncbi:MAG: arylsulfatase [Sphingobium sp.]